jgi:hypothetical protein
MRFSYPVPPEHVWRDLTDPSQVAHWLKTTGFIATAGQRFTFWPGELPSLDPPIRAVILEIAGPTRSSPGLLVMNWEGDEFRCVVTWLVKPAWRGCRLYVTPSSVPGFADPDSQWLVKTCRHMFGERLRAVVVGAAERTNTPGRMWLALRGHWRVVVAVLAMLLLVVGVASAAYILLPVHRPPGATIGPAPGAQEQVTPTLGGAEPSVVPSWSEATRSGATDAGPGPDAGQGPAGGSGSGPLASPAPGPGHLIAGYTTTVDGPLRTFVDVVVSNDGGSAETGWTAALGFDGVNLIVSSNSNDVTQSVQGATYSFTPTTQTETILPGRSVTFRVTVTGLLTGVRSCTIDERACVAA